VEGQVYINSLPCIIALGRLSEVGGPSQADFKISLGSHLVFGHCNGAIRGAISSFYLPITAAAPGSM